jgi:type VI secretion system protein ImpA
MPPLDVGAWLGAVSDGSPAGPNLELDAEFSALDRAAQGKAEQQYGDTIIAAEEPDWKDVEAQALALLERSRDLRVLGHLAVARLHLGGLPDYAEVLTLTRQLVETRWDEIHPQLDPEDDNDPTLRANALLRLGHGGLVLKPLRDMPLANSPRLGHYSWRDVAVAAGVIPTNDPQKVSEAVIRSAFQDSNPEQLAALHQAAETGRQEADAIVAAFEERAGPGTSPDFSELTKLLRQMAQVIQRYMPLTIPDAADPAEAVAEPEADAAAGVPPAMTGAVAHRAAVVTAAALTEITNRADALRLLDLVTQYYQRFEPSSPLPMLIERARSLADKNFLDIVRDLAPDGLGQAQIVVGNRDG